MQVYTRMLIGPDGWAGYEDGVPVLDMGYEFYPASLGNCLRRAWDYTGGSVPLLVTENGIGTTDDAQRIDYVRQALSACCEAIADGVDVRGYTYWSLLDNFEWALGYRPKFGIVGVDRTTFARTPKPSAAWLAVGGGGERARRLRSRSDGGQLRVGHDGVGDGVPERLGQVMAHARDGEQLGTRARRPPSPRHRSG